MSYPNILESHYDICTTVLARGSQIMLQTESAISMASGLAMLAIGVPLIVVFTLDLVAYLSSMALQCLASKLLYYSEKEARLLAGPASVGLVFRMNSPGSLKHIFQKLSTVKLSPPNAGLWLKISDEEH